MQRDDVTARLNELVQINLDGQHRYETAAEVVDNEDYRALFREYATQRAQFADELSTFVSRYGGVPEDDESLSGTVYRAWMSLKSAVTDGDAVAVIAECERGDESAVKAYQDAIAQDLPEEAKSLVRQQFSYVRIAYERVRDLHAVLD